MAIDNVINSIMNILAPLIPLMVFGWIVFALLGERGREKVWEVIKNLVSGGGGGGGNGGASSRSADMVLTYK